MVEDGKIGLKDWSLNAIRQTKGKATEVFMAVWYGRHLLQR